MLGVTWLMRPGRLVDWLAVRGKTVATYRTPTVWGLAHAVHPELWPVRGVAPAGAVTAMAGSAVLQRPEWRTPEVAAVSVGGLLLVASYAWTCEHALLLVPLSVVDWGLRP
jgi:hypothetical protein